MDGAPEAAPRYRVVSSHSGADFEAGRLGHRNGEAPNDGAEHEVVNAHEPEPTRSGSGAGQRSRGEAMHVQKRSARRAERKMALRIEHEMSK